MLPFVYQGESGWHWAGGTHSETNSDDELIPGYGALSAAYTSTDVPTDEAPDEEDQFQLDDDLEFAMILDSINHQLIFDKSNPDPTVDDTGDQAIECLVTGDHGEVRTKSFDTILSHALKPRHPNRGKRSSPLGAAPNVPFHRPKPHVTSRHSLCKTRKNRTYTWQLACGEQEPLDDSATGEGSTTSKVVNPSPLLLNSRPIDLAMVARTVNKAEYNSEPAARAAMDKEWAKLENIGGD